MPGELRGVDGVGLGQVGQERVPGQAGRRVQVEQRRAGAGDLDPDRELAVPDRNGLLGDAGPVSEVVVIVLPPPSSWSGCRWRQPGCPRSRSRRGDRCRVAAEALGPPVMWVLAVGPQVAQVGSDLLGEQLDVLHRQVARQRAEPEHRVQRADAVLLAELAELLADRGRASADDHARVDEVAETTRCFIW